MTLPLYDNGMLAGLVTGFLFGLVLEGAGFGSPRKLTAQFTLRDFAVFKVMFTAVVVAAAGLWLLDVLGVMAQGSVFSPTLFFWSIGAGGLLIGAGFAVGGYCPGTSLAGLASGRLDAVVFGAGMVSGIVVFAALFEPLGDFYRAGQGPKGQTLDQWLGVPGLLVVVVLAAAAMAGIALARRMEKRHGGGVAAQEVLLGTRQPQT